MSIFNKFFNKGKQQQKQYNGYYSQQVLIPPSLSTGDFLRSYG